MKKILVLLFVFACSISCFAQASFGPYTMFPNKKLAGSSYKPQMAFGKVNDQYMLALLVVKPGAYASFNEESILLLKFEDETIAKLPRAKGIEVEKDYASSWNSLLKTYNHFYRTYTSFELDEKSLDRIVNKQQKIIKIRVSYTNGDVQDWDIDAKYQPKFIAGLLESYEKVESKDAVRKETINDVEAGF